MNQTHIIEPLRLYRGDELSLMLDVSRDTLTQARRSGLLRSTRKGRSVLYLGSWVLAWLESDTSTPVQEGRE